MCLKCRGTGITYGYWKGEPIPKPLLPGGKYKMFCDCSWGKGKKRIAENRTFD